MIAIVSDVSAMILFSYAPFDARLAQTPSAGQAGPSIGKILKGFVGCPDPPPPHSELAERRFVGDFVALRCSVLDDDAFEAAIGGVARRQVDARARRDTSED